MVLNQMVRRYGYAPVLFSGAALFLVIGMLLIFFGHTIIGSVVILPGLILMGLGFYQLELLSRLRNQGINVVFMNQESVDNFDKRYQSQRKSKKRLKKRNKKTAR
jgi:hypothetical protein